MSAESVLVALAGARQSHRDARSVWHKIAARLGACDGANYGEGRCFEQKLLDRSEWCAACDGTQDAHAAYRKAASASAAALRVAIAYGKRLAADSTTPDTRAR